MSMDRTQKLMDSIDKWSSETLQQSKYSIVRKLYEELEELSKSESDTVAENVEVADCFHLLLDYASKCGMTFEALLTITEMKHKENKSREWYKDPRGGWRHREKK